MRLVEERITLDEFPGREAIIKPATSNARVCIGSERVTLEVYHSDVLVFRDTYWLYDRGDVATKRLDDEDANLARIRDDATYLLMGKAPTYFVETYGWTFDDLRIDR